jgi:hypothetical protein
MARSHCARIGTQHVWVPGRLVTNTHGARGYFPIRPPRPAVDVREGGELSHPGEAALHSTFCSFPRLDTFFFLHILLVYFRRCIISQCINTAQHSSTWIMLVLLP